MAGSLSSTCPECGTDIQSTWRWCLACGYDPDGRRPTADGAPPTPTRPAPAARPSSAAAPSAPPPTAATTTAPAPASDAAVHARRREVTSSSMARAPEGTKFWVALLVGSLLLAGIVYVVRSRTATVEGPTAAPSGTVAPIAATWAVFNPPSQGFKVELPGQVTTQPPQKFTMGGTETTVHAFTSAQGTTVFGVTYADLGKDATAGGAADLLSTLLDEAAQTMGGAVQSSQPVDVDGRAALDYVVDIRGTTKNQGRLLLDGSRVYTLNVIGPSPRQADVDHLVSSFAIG
jgi:hypothetical protein